MEETYYLQDRSGKEIASGLDIADVEIGHGDLVNEADFNGQEGNFLTNEQAVLPGEEYEIVWQRTDGTEITVGYFGME